MLEIDAVVDAFSQPHQPADSPHVTEITITLALVLTYLVSKLEKVLTRRHRKPA